MRYQYFIDFRHSILVFASLSYGIAVLGTLQCPPPQTRKIGFDVTLQSQLYFEIGF